MCGRYTILGRAEEIASRFGARTELLDDFAHFNAAPEQVLPVVVSQNGERKLVLSKWGFVPHWARDRDMRAMINARAETVAEKPFFRDSFRKTRCLVPAVSYFEWEKSAGKKVPHRLLPTDTPLFAFAGILGAAPGNGVESTFGILTIPAPASVTWIHDRSPLILRPEEEEEWLKGHLEDGGKQAWWQNFALAAGNLPMHSYEVSNLVNSARNNSKVCIEPVQEIS